VKKFETKTTLLLALPVIGFLGFALLARLSALRQVHQEPFVVLKDQFTRGDADGYWGFYHEVDVRFRRSSRWEDWLAPEKSAWYRKADEVVTTLNTKRKVKPEIMESFDAEEMSKPTQQYFQGYDADALDKIGEPLVFETTIYWAEGRDSTVHSTTLHHVLSPQQRRKVRKLHWNSKTKKEEVLIK